LDLFNFNKYKIKLINLVFLLSLIEFKIWKNKRKLFELDFLIQHEQIDRKRFRGVVL
jgi:hypothetical protein